jgi:hypothetical protein
MVKIVLIGKDGSVLTVEPGRDGGLRRDTVYFM